MCFSTGLLYINAKNSIADAAITYISMFTKQLNSEMDTYIGEIDRMTSIFAIDSDISSFLMHDDSYTIFEMVNKKTLMDDFLNKMLVQKPTLNRIIILSRNKRIYSYGSPTILNNDVDDFLSGSWLKRLFETKGELVIMPSHIQYTRPLVNSKKVFSVGRMIRGEGGQNAGSIILDIDPNVIFKASNMDFGGNADYQIQVIITTREGSLLYDSNPENGDFSQMLVGHGSLKTQDLYYSIINRKNYLILSNMSSYTGLDIHVIVPTDNLFHKLIFFRNTTVIIVMTILILFILISLVFSYRITMPVKSLQRAMKLVGTGNLEVSVSEFNDDEFGNLAKHFNRMISELKNMVQTVYIYRLKQEQARLMALQSQINPHLLHNTLESIRMQAVINKDHQVADMIKTLGKLFRLSIETNSEIHNIKDEIEHVRIYLEILEFRYEGRFNLSIDIPEDILIFSIPRLILQPVVENCVLHGFETFESKCNIHIRAVFVEDGILISITDNGSGIPSEKLREINRYLTTPIENVELASTIESIGLKNINDRLILSYGPKYHVSLYSECQKGTTVEILIPVAGGGHIV